MKLEHEPETPVPKGRLLTLGEPKHVFAMDQHGSARRPVQGSNDMKEGALARSRRADNRYHLPPWNGEMDTLQDGELMAVHLKGFVQVDYLNEWRINHGDNGCVDVRPHSYRNAAAGSSLAACREGYSVAAKLMRIADSETRVTSRAWTCTGMREM